MPKKVLFNLFLIVVGCVAVIFGAKFIDNTVQAHGAFYHFTAAGIVTFVATFLAVFLSAMAGFGPVGTKPTVSARQWFALVAIASVVASLMCGGVAGAIGAAVGAACTLLKFRGAM